MAKAPVILDPRSPDFPSSLRESTEENEITCFWAIGDVKILNIALLGLLCSTCCPGHVILQTYDLARFLRDAGVPVIGGFHSPMEKECLDFLLRGKQPIVICPARSIINMRIPAAWQRASTEGRLLILSPFAPKDRRITAQLSDKRNRIVSLLAEQLFVPYAAPGSKTEHLCKNLLSIGKRVYTFESERESSIVKAGAISISLDCLTIYY